MQVGDLEKLPSSTYSSTSRYSRTLDPIDIRYAFAVVVFAPILHTLIRHDEL